MSVTSRLKDPTDDGRFIAASQAFVAWLRSQPGFVRYELFRSPDAQFCDTMLWETIDQAVDATTRFQATDLRAEFAEIVQDYAGFLGRVEPLA